MKAFLATILLISGFGLAAQIRLPAERDATAGASCSSPLCPSEKLLGKIRYIAWFGHNVKTDSNGKKIVDKQALSGSGYWYDEFGNILRHTLFWKGEEKDYLLNSYDDKLRLIKSVDVKFGHIPDSVIYDDVKNTIIRYQDKGRKYPGVIIYSFDKTGNLINLTKQYWGITYEDIYEYDSKKRLARDIYNIIEKRWMKDTLDNDTTAHLVRSDTITYEYIDKENMEIVRKYIQMNGQKLLKEESMVYFKDQTKVFREYGGPYDTDTDSVYVSETDSLVVSDSGSVLYNIDPMYIAHFDKQNRITSQYFEEYLPDKTTFQYKLDTMGNWIEQQFFEDGELSYVRKRIIKYFE